VVSTYHYEIVVSSFNNNSLLHIKAGLSSSFCPLFYASLIMIDIKKKWQMPHVKHKFLDLPNMFEFEFKDIELIFGLLNRSKVSYLVLNGYYSF